MSDTTARDNEEPLDDKAGTMDNQNRFEAIIIKSATKYFRQLSGMAFQEYRLSLRNRWAVGLTILFGTFAILLLFFGGSDIGTMRIGPLIASFGSLATYLVPLAALAYGHTIVVGADEQGWLDMLFALPTPRWIVVLGKYLGRAGTLAVSIAIGFGFAGVWLGLRYTVGSGLDLFASLIFWTIGLGLVFLALATLVSVPVTQRTHALGISLIAWLWFVLVHDLVALGIVTMLGLRGWALSLLVLLNPVDIFRILILQNAGARGAPFTAVFAETGLSMPILIVGLIAWILVPISLAAYLIQYRQV
ncbi:MAG: ABC transporter permease [Halobacteriaceae archaeon]